MAAAGLGAQATYVNNVVSLNADDLIAWGLVGNDGDTLANPSIGSSVNGLRFRLSKAVDGEFMIYRDTSGVQVGDYFVTSENSHEIDVEFERPVGAAGAQVRPASVAATNIIIRAFDENGNLILQSSEARLDGGDAQIFMGAIANGVGIKRLQFISQATVVDLGRIDVHRDVASGDGSPGSASSLVINGSAPMMYASASTAGGKPVAYDKKYTIRENDSILSPSTSVLATDENADTCRLVRGPEKAEEFRLNPDGSVYYRPKRFFTGEDSFTYVAQNSANNTESLPAIVHIEVQPVNQAPTFLGGPDIRVPESSGPQRFDRWATQMNTGAPDEHRQKLDWIVTNDRGEMFATQPALNADGDLRFETAKGASGTAMVTVWLKDDGGIDNGGIDTSAPYKFKIEIAPINHAPVVQPFGDRSVKPGDHVSVQIVASDPDDGQMLTFALENPPVGMTVDALRGVIDWTPTAGQAGQFKPIVKVTDTGTPALTTSAQLPILVSSTGAQIAALAIPIQTIKAGAAVRLALQPVFRATAGATYLMASEVSGAYLDPSRGVFSWTTSQATKVGSYNFLVLALDQKTGAVSPVKCLTVQVEAGARPSLAHHTTKKARHVRRSSHRRRHR